VSTETPETPVAATPPTPENVAEMLTMGDNDYHDGNYWHPSLSASGNVVRIEIEPYATDYATKLPRVHFRAVVLPGEAVPIVLEHPAKLGLTWDDGGDLLSLTSDGILFNPRGVDVWDLDPAGARELAAHLAAMADAYEAAQADRGDAS
jgi:hypothetical protein